MKFFLNITIKIYAIILFILGIVLLSKLIVIELNIIEQDISFNVYMLIVVICWTSSYYLFKGEIK